MKYAIYLPDALLGIFMGAALFRNDWTSITALIVILFIYKMYREKPEPAQPVDLMPLQVQIDDINERFDQIKSLTEKVEKQLNLSNIAKGFKTLGSKE